MALTEGEEVEVFEGPARKYRYMGMRNGKHWVTTDDHKEFQLDESQFQAKHRPGFELHCHVYPKYPHPSEQGEIVALGVNALNIRCYKVRFPDSPTSWFTGDQLVIEVLSAVK